ncbi:tripartite tricarboxylate transporter permease [Martelella endophytica]|uniref:C4-dicarboxylate ABC transporter permease n=1 Tax=Martelella endophytica TaxID=1486262 RepID=A0A0D5LNP4_MAREN|nr:tripartite tricarboxylate transporter permease [Martelella endophytica]AJY44918.1 C4-dicarboxylate ABC transporter permease [Martelella endophytica]
MDLIPLSTVAAGLSSLMQPDILLWCLVGVIVGFIFGASPGLTATTGVAIATPLTFGVDFNAAMALLLGIYAAGYYAGSIPAILINTPGSPGNAATALPGYRLARKGLADYAIGLSTIGSSLGGLLSLAVLLFLAPKLSTFALKFTSVEYFSLGIFGLMCVAAVAGGSIIKGIIAAAFGMLISTVGIDQVDGVTRFAFGMPELQGGIPLIPALIAFFAIAEILSQIDRNAGDNSLPEQKGVAMKSLVPVFARNWWVVIQSAVVGTFIGILPGTGPTIASWIAYGMTGAGRSKGAATDGDAREIEDDTRHLIASEVSNNAVTGGALVPLLTLGIPGDTVTAVLVGALLIQGIDPGPFFIMQNGDLFVVILGVLLISAILITVLGLGARRLLPKILAIPYPVLTPIVAILCVTGVYAVNNSSFDVILAIALGILGFVLLSFRFPMPPIVIGLVLGPIIETNFRNGLLANHGDPMVFITRPISGVLLAIVAALLVWQTVRHLRRTSSS